MNNLYITAITDIEEQGKNVLWKVPSGIKALTHMEQLFISPFSFNVKLKEKI